MTPTGQCAHCGASNSFEVAQCLDCRQPLPWAATVQKYSAQMDSARRAVQGLQAQLQGQPPTQQPTIAPAGSVVPLSISEENSGANRFQTFLAAFFGRGVAAFEELNDDRARVAGVLLAGFWNLCVLVGMWLIVRNLASLFGSFMPFLPGAAARMAAPGLSLENAVKILAVSMLCWAVLVGLCALARTVGSEGQSSLAGDLFVAGVALLPGALFWLLAGLVGLGNYDFVAVLWLFAACYSVMLLYRGLTTVSKVRPALAAACVPLMFLINAFALKVIITRLLTA